MALEMSTSPPQPSAAAVSLEGAIGCLLAALTRTKVPAETIARSGGGASTPSTGLAQLLEMALVDLARAPGLPLTGAGCLHGSTQVTSGMQSSVCLTLVRFGWYQNEQH